MSSDNNQLSTDYDQVVASLRQYASVNLIKTTGDPPDHYEIEYELKGYVTGADGNVTTDTLHRVQIDLPFGYPHFSPICKPLSPIFHPDFDSDAIRVADFWNKEKSLVGLIIHIGQMISGATFSTVDPFNQAALQWYERHRHELPLDDLRCGETDPDHDGIDTLDDDLFAALMLENDSENPPTPEEDPGPQDSVPEALEQPSSDMAGSDSSDPEQLLRQAMEQKKIYEARRILRRLPHDYTLPGRQEIAQSITEVIDKAELYHTEAKKFEQLGRLEQAQKALARVETLVADYPGLDEDLQRVESSLHLSDPSGSRSLSVPTTPERSTPSSLPPGIKGIARSSGTGVPAKRKKKSGSGSRLKPVSVALLVLLALVIGGRYYLESTNTLLLEQTKNGLAQARGLIDRQMYQAAKEKLDAAKESLDKIRFHQTEKTFLHNQLETMLHSQDLSEGLQGRVAFQGRYVPMDQVAALKEIAQRLENGSRLASEHNWKQAAEEYKEALRLAKDNNLSDQQQKVEEAVSRLKLNQALLAARTAEKMEKWPAAAKHYQRAYQLAAGLPDDLHQVEIAGRLAEVKFHHLFEQGKQAFVESEWQQAIDFIQQAQKILENSPVGLTARKKDLLAKNLFQVKLYQTRAKAIQAYNVADWDRAIRLYDRALEMIANNPPLVDDTIRKNNRNIKRSRLLAIIARDRELAVLAERKNKPQQALNLYRGLVAAMDQNTDVADQEVVEVRKEIEKKIDELEENLFLDEKIAYLLENYQQLIRKHYPNARANKMDNPKAEFLGRENGDLLFELSCLEKSRSSNFLLVVNYRYSPDTDSWSVDTR